MGKHDNGFSLLETLVALVLFTLVVSALHRSLTGGWGAVRLARMDERALHVVKTELAAAGVAYRLEEGTKTGETDDGLVWTVEVKRVANSAADDPAHGMLAGYWVTAIARWEVAPFGTEKSVSLTTVKLDRVP